MWTDALQTDGKYASGLIKTWNDQPIVGIDKNNSSLFWETTLGELLDHLGDTSTPLKICRPIDQSSHLYNQYQPTMGYVSTPDWFQIGDDTLTANYIVVNPKSKTFNLNKYDCETRIILRQNGLLAFARIIVETPRGTDLDLIKITMSNPKDSVNARSSIHYSYDMQRFAESTANLLSTAELIIVGSAYDSSDVLHNPKDNDYLGRHGQHIQCPVKDRMTPLHMFGLGSTRIVDMIEDNLTDSMWVDNLAIALRSPAQTFVKVGLSPDRIHPQKNQEMWADGTWTGVDRGLLKEIIMWKRASNPNVVKTVFIPDSLEVKLLQNLQYASKQNFFTYLQLHFGEMEEDVRNLFEVSYDDVTVGRFKFNGATNWWRNKFYGDGENTRPTGKAIRHGSVYSEGEIRRVRGETPKPTS